METYQFTDTEIVGLMLLTILLLAYMFIGYALFKDHLKENEEDIKKFFEQENRDYNNHLFL
jgi:uncharacterized membrane protein YqhA